MDDHRGEISGLEHMVDVAPEQGGDALGTVGDVGDSPPYSPESHDTTTTVVPAGMTGSCSAGAFKNRPAAPSASAST